MCDLRVLLVLGVAYSCGLLLELMNLVLLGLLLPFGLKASGVVESKMVSWVCMEWLGEKIDVVFTCEIGGLGEVCPRDNGRGNVSGCAVIESSRMPSLSCIMLFGSSVTRS